MTFKVGDRVVDPDGRIGVVDLIVPNERASVRVARGGNSDYRTCYPPDHLRKPTLKLEIVDRLLEIIDLLSAEEL